MFGKQKLPKEALELFVEAYACSSQGEVLDTKVKLFHKWLRENADPQLVVELVEAVSKRHDEIVAQRIKDKGEAEKAKKPEPRKAIVPDDKADEILRLWNDYEFNDKDYDASLVELYALEKALFAVCPEIKEWGADIGYDLDVECGKLVVWEVFED